MVRNDIYCKSFSNRLKQPQPLLVRNFHYARANTTQVFTPLAVTMPEIEAATD